jgi:hypothetical protein
MYIGYFGEHSALCWTLLGSRCCLQNACLAWCAWSNSCSVDCCTVCRQVVPCDGKSSTSHGCGSHNCCFLLFYSKDCICGHVPGMCLICLFVFSDYVWRETGANAALKPCHTLAQAQKVSAFMAAGRRGDVASVVCYSYGLFLTSTCLLNLYCLAVGRQQGCSYCCKLMSQQQRGSRRTLPHSMDSH